MSMTTTGLPPIDESDDVSQPQPPPPGTSLHHHQPPPSNHQQRPQNNQQQPPNAQHRPPSTQPRPPNNQQQPPNTQHRPPNNMLTPPPLPRRLTTTPSFRPPPPTFVHPCPDLLGNREHYIDICVPLYEASMNGDWEAANAFFTQRKELQHFCITENYETALHVAASAQSTKFVEALVDSMDKDDLVKQNKNGNTALCLAAAAGNKKMCEIMVKKNPSLLTIPGSQDMMPLYMAALIGNRDTVKYLYDNSKKMSDDFWKPTNRGWVLLKCIEADLFDIALKILEDIPELAVTDGVLDVLARKPYAFDGIKPNFLQRIINKIAGVVHVKVACTEKESDAMKILKIVWKNIMKLPKEEIDNMLRGPHDKVTAVDGKSVLKLKNGRPAHSSRVLFVATEMGNTKFVVELIRQYPDLIWKKNDDNQSIFHIAVLNRRENIYNLLYELGSMKDMITPLKDPEGNNMLHLVGKNATKNRLQNVTGVAFQMQRELLWFEEVKSMIPPTYREKKNAAGLTPHELFTKNHKELVSDGEEWMKGTANQCMVVAALIATMVFAVAFSIPGGYNQNSGFPMFLRKRIFIAFVVSDALSLIFSSASILMFLSILTSRYAQQDFLESLPQKLMIGLATLFLSIMTMMIAFSVSFFLLYRNHLVWVPILIMVVASVPVILYAKLQYPLLVDVYGSIYGSRYIFKPKRGMIYHKNPKF